MGGTTFVTNRRNTLLFMIPLQCHSADHHDYPDKRVFLNYGGRVLKGLKIAPGTGACDLGEHFVGVL